MTDIDARRIHERLDEIVNTIGDQAVALAKITTCLTAMNERLALDSTNRAATCPHAALFTAIERRIERLEAVQTLLKWSGGIVTAALLIPGLRAAGERLAELLLGR